MISVPTARQALYVLSLSSKSGGLVMIGFSLSVVL